MLIVSLLLYGLILQHAQIFFLFDVFANLECCFLYFSKYCSSMKARFLTGENTGVHITTQD